MAFTTTTNIGGQADQVITTSQLMPPYYADFMRENLYGNMFWRQLGTLVTIPRGHGDTFRISRWDTPIYASDGQMTVSGNSAVASAAETDAVPTPAVLGANSLTGTVVLWRGARGYNDKVVITSMADFTEGALESLGIELAHKIDQYHLQKLSGGAFDQVAVTTGGTTSASAAATNTLNSKTVARIRPLMGASNVPKWSDGTYVGLAHELAAYDMFMDTTTTGFVSVARYNHARKIFRGEIGEFYGVRWLLTNSSVPKEIPTTANSASLNIDAGVTGSNAYIVSPDAFYCPELETGGVEVFHQPLGSAGTADPVAQNASIGVKLYAGVTPTPSAEKRIMRLAHALTLGF